MMERLKYGLLASACLISLDFAGGAHAAQKLACDGLTGERWA